MEVALGLEEAVSTLAELDLCVPELDFDLSSLRSAPIEVAEAPYFAQQLRMHSVMSIWMARTNVPRMGVKAKK